MEVIRRTNGSHVVRKSVCQKDPILMINGITLDANNIDHILDDKR